MTLPDIRYGLHGRANTEFLDELHDAALEVERASAARSRNEIGLEEHPGRMAIAYERYTQLRDMLWSGDLLKLTRAYRKVRGIKRKAKK